MISLKISYAFDRPVLLNVSEELGDDDVGSVREDAVLDDMSAASDGGDHAVKNKRSFPEDEL